MDDLEESGDFGVFWSLLSAELHRRVRYLAIRRYARFTEEWSVCLVKESCRGDEGPSIDNTSLVSTDDDAREKEGTTSKSSWNSFGFIINPPARGLTRTIGLKTTESIFEALDSEELVFLRNLTFAKVLILDDNPPFFDAFGNFRTCEEVEDKQDVQNLDFVCLEA
ncbi:hypothetical protein YC2023_059447 [Brassica napus]